jgi:hypothetical protein
VGFNFYLVRGRSCIHVSQQLNTRSYGRCETFTLLSAKTIMPQRRCYLMYRADDGCIHDSYLGSGCGINSCFRVLLASNYSRNHCYQLQSSDRLLRTSHAAFKGTTSHKPCNWRQMYLHCACADHSG